MASSKPNQRLRFLERPGARTPWVCQSTAAAMLEAQLLERESPGVYVITMNARILYVEELTARLHSREAALRR